LAITDTSIITMLFTKNDNFSADNMTPKFGTQKTKNNDELNETKENRTNPKKNQDTDKPASFKTVFEKQVKKQHPEKQQKDKSSVEDLKKKKTFRPLYVVPKEKTMPDSLLIKDDKKSIGELLTHFTEGKLVARKIEDLIRGRIAAKAPQKKNTGRLAGLSIKEAILKTAKNEKSQKSDKSSHVPKLIVVDLREKVPAHKLKNNHKKTEAASLKPVDNILDTKDMKLFVKHTQINDGMVNLKSDFDVKHMQAKQPLPQFTQLQKNLSAELVRQTRMLIKDGGNGEIRLVLKPESLGNVRVRVNIHDNNIVGKIFVDNNTVRELVQGSLHNLYNAFKHDGFNQAMINVFVGSERGGSGNARQNGQDLGNTPELHDLWENERVPIEEVTAADSLVNIVL